MQSGRSIRFTTLFLLHLFVLQVLTVTLCAAGALQVHPHQHAQQREQHRTTHHCCTETSVQLIKADRLYTATQPGEQAPAPLRLLPPASFILTLLNDRPTIRPVVITQYPYHPPIPDIRIAIQSFQI